MKTIFIMLVFAVFNLTGAAQEKRSSPKSNTDEVEISPPKFTGLQTSTASNQAFSATRSYFQQIAEYPADAVLNNIEGIAVASFTVTAEGNIEDIHVENSICPSIDAELVRTIKSTDGMWLPGLKNGEPASMTQEISLAFSLHKGAAATYKFFKTQAKYYYEKASRSMVLDKNFRKAEKYLNSALKFMPGEKNLYFLRGICRYENGNLAEASADWDRFSGITGYVFVPGALAFDSIQSDT